MASGDFYQVIMKQSYNNVKFSFNVFWFHQVSGTGDAGDLLDKFEFYYLSKIPVLQPQLIDTEEIAAINVNNVADYESRNVSGQYPGTNAVECLPPFVCWTFRLNRTARGHHHGYKRFIGVGENAQSGGVLVGYATPVSDVESIMGQQMNPGTGDKWDPQIHRAANSIKPTYNNAEAFFGVSTCSFVGFTTQNSRKF